MLQLQQYIQWLPTAYSLQPTVIPTVGIAAVLRAELTSAIIAGANKTDKINLNTTTLKLVAYKLSVFNSCKCIVNIPVDR